MNSMTLTNKKNKIKLQFHNITTDKYFFSFLEIFPHGKWMLWKLAWEFAESINGDRDRLRGREKDGERQRERETARERQRERDRKRQKETERDRETDKQRKTLKDREVDFYIVFWISYKVADLNIFYW